MNITRIDTVENFEIEYPRVRPWLLNALDYSTNPDTERELLEGLFSRKYTLWVSDNAACVVELAKIDHQLVCFVYLIGGEYGAAIKEILSGGQEAVEEWAKSQGCKGFYASARPEWERVLSRYDFKAQSINYYKEF